MQTKRGAEQYERELRQELLDGRREKEAEVQEEKPEAPRLAALGEEFVETYAVSNNKLSEQAAEDS